MSIICALVLGGAWGSPRGSPGRAYVAQHPRSHRGTPLAFARRRRAKLSYPRGYEFRSHRCAFCLPEDAESLVPGRDQRQKNAVFFVGRSRHLDLTSE